MHRRACAPILKLAVRLGRSSVVSAFVQGEKPAGGPTRRRSIAGLLATAGTLVAGCSNNSQYLSSTPPGTQTPQAPQANIIGTGAVKVGLLLPLSAAGNAGLAGQSM